MSDSKVSSTTHRNLINFIPETQRDLHNNKKKKSKSVQNRTQRLGQEVKSFYENLINDETCKNSEIIKELQNTKQPTSSDSRLTRKRKKELAEKFSSGTIFTSESSSSLNASPIDPTDRQHFKLLQCSQLGDVKAVKDLLNKGLNVNFLDFYKWTPLMCASKEGHSKVIKVLLKNGADKCLRNSVGDTALSIALTAGHSAAVSVLKNSDDDTEIKVEQSSRAGCSSSSQVFHCEVCKRDFSLSEANNHQTSTVHLFNSGHRPKGPSYFIPDSNRGFQMLLRSGWDGQHGLGPEGQGRTYPIKTVFKQDRVGLGGDDDRKKKAKVTHFGCGDVEAVDCHKKNPLRQMSVRKMSKNAARLKDKKERRWEQNLRFEMR